VFGEEFAGVTNITAQIPKTIPSTYKPKKWGECSNFLKYFLLLPDKTNSHCMWMRKRDITLDTKQNGV